MTCFKRKFTAVRILRYSQCFSDVSGGVEKMSAAVAGAEVPFHSFTISSYSRNIKLVLL